MSNSKDEEKGDHIDGKEDEGLALLKAVALTFRQRRDDAALYGGDAEGGLEVIFEDFVEANADTFLNAGADAEDGSGYSHELTALHTSYLEQFERACEWAIEVEGSADEEGLKQFYGACSRLQSGEIEIDGAAAEKWFVNAVFSAMDYQQFCSIMTRAAEKHAKRRAK